MELNKKEFKHEIQSALKDLLEIEEHAEEMDSDDIKELCRRIGYPLKRMLQDIDSGKTKEKKF